MERMTARARRTGMMNQRRIRGLATAGLMCAALAGCGTAMATTTPSGAGARTVAPEVGCHSVNQATSVTVLRLLLVSEPINSRTRMVKQRNARLVRALFGDFCAAVSHPPIRQPIPFCPIDLGTSYTGTFYDGQRVLATFLYHVSGCPRVSITAAGKTKSVLLLGSAAAAAPHLKADMAAVLGVSVKQVYGAETQTIAPVRQGM
jgi:hypothetical protein